MIQYQILKTNFAKTVWQTVRRITNEILGVKGLKDLFLFNHIKQIDSMLWVCSVIDQKRHNTVLRTSVIHSWVAPCVTFLFLPHFNVISCDLLLNICTATWNLFDLQLKSFRSLIKKEQFILMFVIEKKKILLQQSVGIWTKAWWAWRNHP